MNTRQFKHDMIRGLGSCYLELSNNESIEQFKSNVMFGCLNPISYEHQMEGTRSHYIYRLLQFFNDDLFFEEAIIKKLNGRVSNDDLFIHLVERLSHFANDGSLLSKQSLYQQYDKLITKRHFTDIDAIKLDYLSVLLLGIDGIRFVKYHLKKVKKVSHKITTEDLGWLYYSISRKYKEKYTELIQEVYPSYPKEISYPFEQIDFSFDNLLKHIDDENWFIRFSAFSSRTDDIELVKAIDYVIDTNNIQYRKQLLQLFKRDSGTNYRISEIIEMIGKYGEDVDRLIYHYCRNVKDSRIKKLGLSLLDNKSSRSYGLQMIIHNYASNDSDLLIKYTKKVKVDYTDSEDWFYLFSSLLDFLDNKKKNLPTELLFYIYNESLTSYKREHAFDIMKKRGIIDIITLTEAQYDSDFDISNKAKRIIKKK